MLTLSHEVRVGFTLKLLALVLMFEHRGNDLDDLGLLQLAEERLLENETRYGLEVLLEREKMARVDEVLLLVLVDEQWLLSL